MDGENPSGKDIKLGLHGRRRAGWLVPALAGLSLLSAGLWLIRGEETAVSSLLRPEVGEASEELELGVRWEDGSEWIWQGELAARIYSEEELERCMEQAAEWVFEQLPREGETLDQVVTGVDLVKAVPETGVTVAWSWSEKDILDREGNVCQEALTGEVIMELTAELTCQQRTELLQIPLRLVPVAFGKEEQRQRELTEKLNQLAAQGDASGQLELPDSWGEVAVTFFQKEEKSWWVLPLATACFLLLWQAHRREEEKTQEKDRKEAITLQYPQFVSRFVVLLGAGMNVSSVWLRLAAEYEQRRAQGREDIDPLYEAVCQVAVRLRNGEQERRVYDEFGKSTGVQVCQRFAAILGQNLRMGSERVLEQMEYEAAQALEERKARARSQGEEMGTKLLLPMMVQLLLILVMVMLPAFMSM